MLIAMTLAVATIPQLADEYLRQLWKDSPMTATAAGYHGEGVDERLDDLSPAARQRRRAFLRDFARRLEAATAAARDREDAADAALLGASVALSTLELDEAHDFARRCDTPLDDLGSTFFQMTTRADAPLERRAARVLARLDAVPRYLGEVRASLQVSVDEFRAAARDDGDGLIDYLQKELLPPFAAAPQAAALGAAVARAVDAVHAYLAFVDGELTKKPHGSFRYGAALYRKRFRPYLQTDLEPAEVLAAAERRLAELQKEMQRLAAAIVPGGDVRAALARAGDDRFRPSELFGAVRAQLDEARAFVRARGLLTLEARDNLRVVETPPFMRSIYAVAGFEGAPPLEPSFGAFYYVTPIPADWPPARVEAKLREYNRWMLDLITIHEAMPGHYVQFERANSVEPVGRRVLRNLLGAGSYIEGWAVYAQDLMVDAGYRNGDPRLKLMARKLELRAVLNAILDIRLQLHDLDDASALKLMMDAGYQERPEAEAKLRRAKLSVTQLCSYFVGGEAWHALRRAAEARPGFDARAFHDRALGEGAVTLPTLRTLLLH
jgi:uncharacterized protein (DUF885 family)